MAFQESRLAALMTALSTLPDLSFLSLPTATLDGAWPRLTALKHLVVRQLDVAGARQLPSPDMLPALTSVEISIRYRYLCPEDPLAVVPFLTRLPVTRIAVYTATPSELQQLRVLTSLTGIDLTWGSSSAYMPRDVPDFTALPRLRYVNVMSFNRDAIEVDLVATPSLTSLTLAGSFLSEISLPYETYRLPPTLAHLSTVAWKLVLRAPASLRSLECFAEPHQLPHLARFAALATLLLPLVVLPQGTGTAVLTGLTRLEELGVYSTSDDLSVLSSLRTLRLGCDAGSLPPPSPHISTLHLTLPDFVDASALVSVARRWPHLRHLTLKGRWGYLTRDEWRTFAAAMSQLLVFRMHYAIFTPPRMTVSGATEAFAGKRLEIEY